MLIDLINKSIEQYLKTDPDTASQLKPLQNKKILLELVDINQRFLLLGEEKTIFVQWLQKNAQIDVDTIVCTNTISAFRMAIGGEYQDLISSGALKIEGDAGLASTLRDVLIEIDIDWEEIASKYVGDSAAYQLGLIFKKAKSYKSRSKENFRLDVSEYLQEEVRIVPTKVELNRYFNDVDILEADIDRLEARINRLFEKIA